MVRSVTEYHHSDEAQRLSSRGKNKAKARSRGRGKGKGKDRGGGEGKGEGEEFRQDSSANTAATVTMSTPATTTD